MSGDDNDIDDILKDIDQSDDGWILEFETALLSDCDMHVLRRISNQKSIPARLRNEYWQVCLGIKGRSKILEDIYDLPEQLLIRQDCQKLVDNLDNCEDEKLSILSDLESIITNFSRLNNSPYRSNNGWIELLGTLIQLNEKRDELFKVFETIQLRYIPRYYNSPPPSSSSEDRPSSCVYMQPFHLLRLILLYHYPKLCNHFDTLKLTADQFSSSWFRSLFCSSCDYKVSLTFLDNYFTNGNAFLIFFISLVMIINLEEDLLAIKCKESLMSTLRSIPESLVESDIKDMFSIASEHFLKKTPRSIQYFQHLFFQVSPRLETISNQQAALSTITDLSSLLCLPISIEELLSSFDQKASPSEKKQSLRYFVVDCRSPDQYNNGHLSIAFHLDCSLMLNDPSAFATAVQALLASQQQAIDANSIAGGEHLCFIGNGRHEEDCYVHMVVSSFLQRHHRYVSLLRGGYDALHRYLFEKQLVEKYLVDHNWQLCLPCRGGHNGQTAGQVKPSQHADRSNLKEVLFQKLSSVVKPKISEMKEKLVEYVVNPNHSKPVVKHVSQTDKIGKRYKANQFSLDDAPADLEEMVDEDSKEFTVEEWKLRNNTIGCFDCAEMLANGKQLPSYLAVTESHLILVRQTKEGHGVITSKRPLETVVQITSKKKNPEIITFRYTLDNQSRKEKDTIFLEKPFDVIRLIKQKIVQILEQEDN